MGTEEMQSFVIFIFVYVNMGGHPLSFVHYCVWPMDWSYVTWELSSSKCRTELHHHLNGVCGMWTTPKTYLVYHHWWSK